MREVVLRVAPDFQVELRERDVREDPELERRYLLEIPVLLLGETEIARHRVSASELRAQLARLVSPRS